MTTDPKSAAPPAGAAAAPSAILAVLAFVAVIHVGWWAVADAAVGYGNLADSDAYAWLVRAERLIDTGGWFDVSLPRANAPEGGSLHWTRPLDVLLIGLALPMAPLLGVHGALFWAGALVSPLLHLMTAAALAWAAAPLVGRAAALIAGALTATQFGILGYTIIGRADHHVLLALAAVVAFGFMVRAFLATDDGARPATAAGAALAFGIWVGVEAQVMAALCVAAIGIEWVLAGDRALARNRRLAVGLLGGMAAALLIERGPAAMIAVEYDRISVVHVAAAALLLAFWSAVAGLARRGHGPRGVMTRLLAAIGGAALALALLRNAFPRLLVNPIGDFDPAYLEIFERTAELAPIADVWHFLLYVGATVVALPWAIKRARDEWPGGRRWPWLLLIGLAAVYAALAVTWLRWSMFADLFLLVIVADGMIAAEAAIERRFRPPARMVVKTATMLLLAVGPLVVGAAGVFAAMPAATVSPAGVAGDPRPCPLQPLARFLASPPWGDEPRTIVASANFGAELLYRTPHRVTATVHHRNRSGVVDSVRILGGVDDAAILDLVRKRRIDLLLICRHGHDAYVRKGDGDGALYRRLESGAAPAWLAEVPLPETLRRSFKLFRVTAGR